MMATVETTGGLKRWIVSMLLMGLLLGATLFTVVWLTPGETYIDRLGAAYEAVWSNTTQRPFTFIMRDYPWLYLMPAFGVIFITGWQLPRKFWARAIFTYLVFIIGFIGGHVFW